MTVSWDFPVNAIRPGLFLLVKFIFDWNLCISDTIIFRGVPVHRCKAKFFVKAIPQDFINSVDQFEIMQYICTGLTQVPKSAQC